MASPTAVKRQEAADAMEVGGNFSQADHQADSPAAVQTVLQPPSRPDAQHQRRKRGGVVTDTIPRSRLWLCTRQARKILVHPPITQFPCKTPPPRQDEVKCGCMCRQGVVGWWSAEGGSSVLVLVVDYYLHRRSVQALGD